MSEQSGEIGDWGKGVLEEVLFRTALRVSEDDGASGTTGTDLHFRVTADRDAAQIIVVVDRIGSQPLTLDVALAALSVA